MHVQVGSPFIPKMADAQISAKYMYLQNQKGGENLAHVGFIYRVNRRYKDRIYWICTVSGCPATITTINEIPSLIRQQHNHAADDAHVCAKQIMSVITKKCVEEVRPIPSIFVEELVKLRGSDFDETDREVIERLPTFNSARSSLYRARRKLTPNLPKLPADITLDGKWTETSTAQPFLLLDYTLNSQRTIVFATRENLCILATADTFYCDGTFYTCPDQFHQIYSLHVLNGDVMMPVVFALLPGKTQQIFNNFFTKIKEVMSDRGMQLNPINVFVDFEIAVHNVLRQQFLGVHVRGCFFHFTQCIWRKAQATGLPTLYREHEDVKTLIRRSAALPLLPMHFVEDVWFETIDSMNDSDLAPAVTHAIIEYVQVQWIDGDVTSWNHFDNDRPRTTNHLEAWHLKLKRKIQHSHPNIFTIIQTFKDIQNANEINIIQLQAGGSRRRKAKRYMNIDRRLQILKERLVRGILSPIDYTDKCSDLLHLE